MSHSRRDFFKLIVNKNNQTQVVDADTNIMTLGHLTIFPVHSSTKIKLLENEFIVESLPEGIRLQNLITNENLKLSLNSHGLIQAHLKELWPSTAVLSLFTGELYNI